MTPRPESNPAVLRIRRGGSIFNGDSMRKTFLFAAVAALALTGCVSSDKYQKELEQVMTRFMHHQFDVLVATTIIENGLDIPLANTLIVNRADRYGLSQLYQLRGRVQHIHDCDWGRVSLAWYGNVC